MAMITPMYGHGPARAIPSRRSHTSDLFGPTPDDEARRHHRIRTEAVLGYLDGTRPNPGATAFELNGGSELGGDDLDACFDTVYLR